MRVASSAVHRRRSLPVVLYGVLSGAVLLLFSGWNKPLLYDEFVYFAAAGLPDTQAALATVWETTTNVNQGVTGVFLMSDFWLLHLFGAHTEALRLPGLISAGLLFVYSGAFLMGRELSVWVLPAVPVAYTSQELVLRYVGEARTYMPLAAASVGILAYYSFSSSARQSIKGRLVGWSSIILGVLFHPYFIVYWIALFLFAYFLWGRSRSLREFANVPLVVVGLVAYLVIGALTWMRGKANADVDPFNFLPGPLPVEILAQNLYFVSASSIALVSLAVVLLAPILVSLAFGRRLNEIWLSSKHPLLLMAVAVALSLALSVSTIVNDFWIFPRQWIASTALVCLAGIWLVAEWWKLSDQSPARPSRSTWRPLGLAIASIALIVMVLPSIEVQVQNILKWQERPTDSFGGQLELRERLDGGEVLTDAEWTSYAQRNLDEGGGVWKEFGRYYTDTDWSTFLLTDR